MRPGDNPEIGKVHELYLDWKSTPPRAPDDVIVIDIRGKTPDEGQESELSASFF